MNPSLAPAARPRVPAPLAAVLSRLPRYPGSLLLVLGLNAVLARQLPPDVAAHMQGKLFCIQVRDAGLRFDFAWQRSLFLPCAPQPEPDLTLSADACDLLRLAQRLDDPDTLFFNRRLSLQGDTELGLVVKNALDALDWPLFGHADWTPPALLQRLRQRLDARCATAPPPPRAPSRPAPHEQAQ